jgi:hypothetical protein
LAAVVLVRQGEIRIARNGLAALWAPEAHQGSKHRFYKHLNDNQKAPFAVCVGFEK